MHQTWNPYALLEPISARQACNATMHPFMGITGNIPNTAFMTACIVQALPYWQYAWLGQAPCTQVSCVRCRSHDINNIKQRSLKCQRIHSRSMQSHALVYVPAAVVQCCHSDWPDQA